MARITTKELLKTYIKQQLGAPLIQVEVNDDQMEQIIDDAIQHFTEYAYGELEASAFIEIGDMGDYLLPQYITNIVAINTSGQGYMNFNASFGTEFVPDLWSQNFFNQSGNGITNSIIPNMMSLSATRSIIDKFMGRDFNYNFNAGKQLLQVFQNVNSTCLLHYKYEYIAEDEGDQIFNHEWIKRFTVAKTKFLWGTVTGKYDSPLIGGARINYADMKNEASAEMEILEQELLNKWSDPCPISIA